MDAAIRTERDSGPADGKAMSSVGCVTRLEERTDTSRTARLSADLVCIALSLLTMSCAGGDSRRELEACLKSSMDSVVVERACSAKLESLLAQSMSPPETVKILHQLGFAIIAHDSGTFHRIIASRQFASGQWYSHLYCAVTIDQRTDGKPTIVSAKIDEIAL